METTQYDRAFFISVGHGRSLLEMFKTQEEMLVFYTCNSIAQYAIGFLFESVEHGRSLLKLLYKHDDMPAFFTWESDARLFHWC